MSVRKIAYLAPLYFDEECYLGGGERYPLNLAKGVVESSGGQYEVELVSFGPTSFRREIAPGVSFRILKAAGKPAHPLDMVSWELPEALTHADLVHIHQAYTRCSELGILVAKLLETGMITPPIGLNVFIIKSVVPENVSVATIFRGVAYFLIGEAVVIATIVLFPSLIMFLPNLLK